MGRPERSIAPDSWHHVMSRGADRQDIFSDDHDRTHFERLLDDASGEHVVEVHAYCLMSNHFHLLVHCCDDSLSDAMHDLCGRHARAYNQRHGRSGPLFGGRYHSVPIASDEQLITTARYIHRNPLDSVPLRALAAYRWSSFGPYLGHRSPPDWLATTTVSALLSGRDHRRFVEQPLPNDMTPPHGRASAASPSLDQLESVVVREAETTTDTLRRTRRGAPNPARTLILTLALELRIGTAEALATRYGFASAAVVRVTARRGRVRLHDDPSFRRLRDRVLDELFRPCLAPV